MLITFSCDVYENITMFGEIAKTLLQMMGHSESVPGAILAEDLKEALATLKQKLSHAQSPRPNKGEEEDEPPVSLKHRALPLIHMMEAAITQKKNMTWDYTR